MKATTILPVFMLLFLVSCTAIRVNADYDSKTNFANYKTFAFDKNGIDKVQISELDKRRILRAIDAELTKKGMLKSDNPDLLVNIVTKEKEQVNATQMNMGWGFGRGWGWGYNPYWGMGNTYIYSNTEGTLYIDLIDAKTKDLVWEGEGKGTLTEDRRQKEIQINAFVNQILAQYPPTEQK